MAEGAKERDPVVRLFPVVRKQYKNPNFDKLVNDLELLGKARYFPDQVPDRAEIIKRFRAFLKDLPENDDALKDFEEVANSIK